MRVLKGIIGWVCFLSLIVVFFLIGSWVYLTAQPFMNGLGVINRYWPDIDGLGQNVTIGGLQGSDSGLLEDFIHKESSPEHVRSGVDGAWAALQRGGIHSLKREIPGRYARAAVLLDYRGRVLAAYPRDLIGHEFPIGHETIAQLRPPSPYEGAQNYTPNYITLDSSQSWASTFQTVLGKYVPGIQYTLLKLLSDPSGRAIGYLAVASNGPEVALSGNPDNYFRPSWVSNILGVRNTADILRLPIASGILLVFFALLLPIWAGMDAAWRGMRPFAWGILVALTGIIGLVAYLIARIPAPGTCSNCGEKVLSKYVRCPACGASILARCPTCRTKMKPGWQFCPKCAITTPGQSQSTSGPLPPEPETIERPSSQEAALDIIAIDGDSGIPLSNIRICINGTSAVEGTTGPRGSFHARRLKPGSYSIEAARSGYEPAIGLVKLEEGCSETIKLILQACPGRIAGRVTDQSTQEPIPCASVSLDSDRLDRCASTGDDGGYELDGIPPGPYMALVQAEGYQQQAKLTEVRPGQMATLDFTLEAVSLSLPSSELETEEITHE